MSALPPITCPALLISAPASGQGKTTATAALARWYVRQGLRVRVFKTGPDFLDPMVLARASGAPVYQLDLWMGGEAHCRSLLWQAARQADVILVEGVMGLFDGMASSADLAERFGLPVLAVVDAAGMAQTFGAVAMGLASYRPGLKLAGVLANRVAGESHARLLRDSLPPHLHWFGGLPRDEGLGLPSRHLGLVQAGEVDDLDVRLDRAAEALGALGPRLPDPVVFMAPDAAETPGAGRGADQADEAHSVDAQDCAGVPMGPGTQDGAAAAGVSTTCARPLQGVRVAVARDEAFAFIYPANLDVLHALGAQVHFFSPLRDTALPEADAVYLPGGYPELHLQALSRNTAMHAALRHHHAQGRPLLAECGGLLYLMASLADREGRTEPMAGLLPGHAAMRPRLVNLGMQSVELPEGTLRGHTFHHAEIIEPPGEPSAWTRPQRATGRAEAVWRQGGLVASFLHLYFPSQPAAVAALLSPRSPP